MKLKKRHYLILAFTILLTGNVKSQQVIFSESFAELTSVTVINNAYITPALDLSNGVSFLKFSFTQTLSDAVQGGLKVYYKTETDDHWLLLATFDYGEENGKAATLFLPESPAHATIMFLGPVMSNHKISLDNIQVLKYKNASAFSEKNQVYIDTEHNLSSSFLQIEVSDDQISGLPVVNNSFLTPGVPVSCPAGAIIEGEPDCYTDYADSTDAGCDIIPNRYIELRTCNDIVCGKSGTYTYMSAAKRDVDWYRLGFTGTSALTLKVVADFKVRVYVITMLGGCEGFWQYPGTALANAGDTATINLPNLTSSDYVYFWIAPYTPQIVTCGSNYVMIYKTATITNPATPVAIPACAPTQLSPMSPTANYTYYWQGTSCGLTTVNPASNAFPVTAAGTYYVRGVYTPIGCWTPCSSINIGTGVIPTFNPVVPINSGDPLVPLPTTSTNGITGTWAPALNNTVTTTYTFTPNSGQCATTTTLTITVITYTAVGENISAENLVVYPNPANKRLYINFDGMKSVPKNMKLFNALGQVCFETDSPLQDNVEGINVSNMNPGSYYLQIVFENGTVNKPIIVN